MTCWILTLYKDHFKVSIWLAIFSNRRKTIVWPDNPHDWGQNSSGEAVAKWGFSWFELYMNFLFITGQYCPVKVSGALDKSLFTDYMSDTARLLPSDKRSAMTQAMSFQAAFRCTESILRIKLFPDDISKGGKAIHRSLATRPKLQRQVETVDAVYNYIKMCATKKTSFVSVLTPSLLSMTSHCLWLLNRLQNRGSQATRSFTSDAALIFRASLFSRCRFCCRFVVYSFLHLQRFTTSSANAAWG